MLYRVVNMLEVLNLPVLLIWLWFWICQSSEYTRGLNIPGFWICKASEYTKVTQTSECVWISLDNSRICLVMFEYARMLSTNSTLFRSVLLRLQFAIFKNIVQKRICIIFAKRSIAYVWQGCQYAWDSEYTRVLNMPLVLNMPGFCICQGSEYARVLDIPRFWICQVSEYVRVLNIPGFWICQGSEYTTVLNVPGLHRPLNVP